MTPRKKTDDPEPDAEKADAPQQQTTPPPPNNWNDLRAPIESEHNKTRDDREKQYVADRVALEDQYHTDLAQIQNDKQSALVAAGLNPDGSPPSDYGQTAPNLPPLGGI